LPLLLAFILVPLIEIALFIQIGGAIGLWPTLAIVIATAILGATMVRTQGHLAMEDLRRSLSDLTDPAEPLAHGAMILFSGALLLTPGFFTDVVGFALLVPGIRSAVFRWAKRRIAIRRFEMGQQTAQPDDPPRSKQADIIDAEYEDLDPPKRPTHRSSGWTKH